MKGTAHWASQVHGTPSVQTFTPFWTQQEFWMSSTRACSSASLLEQVPLAKCVSERAFLHTPAKTPKAGMSNWKEAALSQGAALLVEGHEDLGAGGAACEREPFGAGVVAERLAAHGGDALHLGDPRKAAGLGGRQGGEEE